MLCIGQIESSFVYAGRLQNVQVAREQSERNRPGDVDTGVLQFALNKE
jgi:hypothetical protein